MKGPVFSRPLAAEACSGVHVLVVEDVGRGITLTKTRSEPWRLGDGTEVVLLEGRSGGYQLSRCFDATELMAQVTDVHHR